MGESVQTRPIAEGRSGAGPVIDLAGWIERFAELRVVVVGDVILDSYLQGVAGGLCREAPVPTVHITQRRDVAGGAGNTAVNIAALGAQVCIVSVVGDDEEARLVRTVLRRQGVRDDGVVAEPGRHTVAKQRVVADSQLLVRFDHGDTGAIATRSADALLEHLARELRGADIAVVSDYDNGVLTEQIIKGVATLAIAAGVGVVVDAKDPSRYRDLPVLAVKASYAEIEHLLSSKPSSTAFDIDRPARVAQGSGELLDKTGAGIVAVTLDVEGAVVIERGDHLYRTYPRGERAESVAGAGDTYTAALALALGAGAPVPAAAELAGAAAGVVVTKDATSSCSAAELAERVRGERKLAATVQQLCAWVDAERTRGRRIVFTNGCFDILHRGHVTYLTRAKALGDVLVVAVNDDASVRNLKGATRPINSLDDRLGVLSALSCVDYLVAFGEATAAPLLKAVRPDVFAKGGDYTRETLTEAPLIESLGGEVRILEYLADRSTTAVIEQIQAGVHPLVRAG